MRVFSLSLLYSLDDCLEGHYIRRFRTLYAYKYRDGAVPFTGNKQYSSRYKRYTGCKNDFRNTITDYYEDDKGYIVKVPPVRNKRKAFNRAVMGEGVNRHRGSDNNWKSHRKTQWKNK